jgi:hypothetical protein
MNNFLPGFLVLSSQAGAAGSRHPLRGLARSAGIKRDRYANVYAHTKFPVRFWCNQKVRWQEATRTGATNSRTASFTLKAKY